MHDFEMGTPRRSRKKKELAPTDVLVILLAGSAVFITLLYAFPALLGLFASKGLRRDNAFEDNGTDNILGRRATSINSTNNLQVIGSSTPLFNSKISVLMQDPTTGNAFTVYTAYSAERGAYLVSGQLHNRLNQNLTSPYFVSQLASGDNNPVLIADAIGYTCFWNTANDASSTGNPGIKYALITPQGSLTNPSQVEFPVNALSAGSKFQVTAAVGSNPGSFSTVFQLVQPNGAISGNDYQLQYRTYQNGAWQGYETQFTQPSFYAVTGPVSTVGYNFIFFAESCLVRIGNTEVNLYLFLDQNQNTASPTEPSSGLFNEIRYIANPSTASNAPGTSLTSAYFPTASATSLFASVNAKVLPDNSIFVTYLKSNVAGTSGPFSEYWQRFTLSGTTLTAIGTPQQIKASNGTPFLIYDTTGPALSATSLGTDLAVASRHVDGVTDQAYTMGFFTNGTIRFNATRLNPYPQQYPETSPALAVDNQNTILARWIANPPSGPIVLGVSRTNDMEAVVPLNPAYTQDKSYYFNLAASLPLNLPAGNNTAFTISIPANDGTLFVANPLPNNIQGNPIVANTTITTSGNTSTLTISAVPGTPLSLMDANTVTDTAGFVPTQYSRAQVPVTFTGVSDQYSFGTTYILANIPVNYSPTVIETNFSSIEGQVQVVNSTMLDFFDAQDNVNGKFVISNAQHCAFISVANPSIPLFTAGPLANYPGTVVTTFTKQQRDSDLIRFWTDGSSTAPSFVVTAVNSLDLPSAPVTVNVPLTLNPAPIVNANLPPMVINVGGTFVFNAQYMSATQGNTPTNQLVYTIQQKTGLFIQYWDTTQNTWVNFPNPNNIQYTQALVDTGNAEQMKQDVTSTDVSISYIVTGTWGATSAPFTANIILNQSPVILKSSANYPAVNTWITLSSNDIYVQDAGQADTIDIFIQQMTEMAMRWASTQAALNENDFVTQDDVNKGRVQSSVSNANAVLKMYAKDQYGAVSSVATMQISVTPPGSKAQGNSLIAIVSSIVGIVGFALTICWRARILYKEKTGRYGTSPLGYLFLQAYTKQVVIHNRQGDEKEKSLTIGDFNNAEGKQYTDSVACIAEQLRTHGITFSALPQERQQAVATAMAVYFLSEAGNEYIVKEKVSPPASEDAGCLESCGDRADACLTKTHNVVFTTRELDNNKVRLHAYEIAQGVNAEYRKLLKEHVTNLRNSSATAGKNVEMASLHPDNGSGSGSSDDLTRQSPSNFWK